MAHINWFCLFSITDAFNETKDKVKYLESLRKYFDQLNVGNSLVNICGHTLPGLMASVRLMDAISRYYARNGYLGLLFSKVTSALCIVQSFLVQFDLHMWLLLLLSLILLRIKFYRAINDLQRLLCQWTANNCTCMTTSLLWIVESSDHQSACAGCKGLHRIQHYNLGRRQTLDKGSRRNRLLLKPFSSPNKIEG